MTVDVLGVHGVGNWSRKAPADAAVALAAKWSRSLRHNSMTVAYYAHHLRLYQQGPVDLDALDAQLDGRLSTFLLTWVGELGFDHGAQGRTFAPIRQLASWLVQRFDSTSPVVETFLSMFLPEVALYFDANNRVRRLAARTTVASALSLHQPRVVIAHSLGSIVTYETLWAYPSIKVELLVTVGSPLAFPVYIHPLLEPAAESGRGNRPPGVRRWINIADPSDLVAIPRPLTNRFDNVDVDVEIPAGLFFTHNADAYLSTGLLRQFVTQHLSDSRL